MGHLIWIAAGLIIAQAYRSLFVRKVVKRVLKAKIFRTPSQAWSAVTMSLKGRGLRCLAFLTGFLLAIALRANNALFVDKPDGGDASFCGINPLAMNWESVNLIQDKVVFVMDTRFKLEQVSTLTRIAQSLFPVRGDVLWVVVSTSVDKDLLAPRKKRRMSYLERKIRMQMNFNNDYVENNEIRMNSHLTNLHNLLVRFGIPFVLMERNCPSSRESEEDITRDLPEEYYKICEGWGADWVLDNIDRGVLMWGNEHFAYHHRIFKEVKKTRIASTWAVGLGRLDGFSGPIWNKSLKTVTGYFNGDLDKHVEGNAIPFEIGGAAVRIELLQKVADSREILRDAIVFQDEFTFESLSIGNDEIQVLGSKGDEILVWRTINVNLSWPNSLRYLSSYANSSVVKLWQNFFTVMYDQIPIDRKFAEKNYSMYM